MNENNIIDILIIGTLLSGMTGLFIAAHIQQIRIKKRSQQ